MIDKSKVYKTRDGREVRIYATDGGGEYPVHGAYLCRGEWRVEAWDEKGFWTDPDHEDNVDLIEVKPRIKREVWVNVYPDVRFGQIFKTKAEADECHYCKKVDPRIACVKLTIDCEEGEGL